MKYKTKYSLTHVDSLESLRREQQVIKDRLKNREETLRLKLYELPAELAAASINKFIPHFLRGKVTNAALNGGKKIINTLFIPHDAQPKNLLTTGVIKHRNFFSLVKKGLSVFKKSK